MTAKLRDLRLWIIAGLLLCATQGWSQEAVSPPSLPTSPALPPITPREEPTESKTSQALAKLHPISRLELRTGTRVTDALRLLSELSGLNIVATREAGDETVELFLTNVSTIAALEALCNSSGLWYREDETTGTIRVMTTEEYQRDILIYRDDKTRVFTLLHPNTSSVATAIRDLYGMRVILSFAAMINDDSFMQTGLGGSGFGNIGSGGGLGGGQGGGFGGGLGGGTGFGNTGVGNTGFGGATSQPFGFGPGSAFGSVSGGGGLGVFGGGMGGMGMGGMGMGGLGGGGFGTGGFGGYLNNLSLQEQMFRNGPLTPYQIQDLAKSAQASKERGEEESVGTGKVQEVTGREPPIYVTINRQHNLVIVRTSDSKIMEDITKLICELDRPTPEVLLEMKILELTLDDNFHSIFDYGFGTGDDSVGPPDGQPSNPLEPIPPNQLTPMNLGTLGNFPTMGGTLVYQLLNEHVRARIELFDSDNRVNTVSAPILLASNKRSASIFVGQQAVLTTGVSSAVVTPGLGATTTAIVPQTQVVNVGTTLLFTPSIDADRTVTLYIVQDQSNILPDANTILVPNADGSVTPQTVDGLAQRTMNATVVAKDGLTIAIGGLITETHTNLMQKVPVIGDIPYIGRLFRREVRQDQKVELVLLITPHVITTPMEGEMRSRWRLDENSHNPRIKQFAVEASPQFDPNKYPIPGPVGIGPEPMEFDPNLLPAPPAEAIPTPSVHDLPAQDLLPAAPKAIEPDRTKDSVFPITPPKQDSTRLPRDTRTADRNYQISDPPPRR